MSEKWGLSHRNQEKKSGQSYTFCWKKGLIIYLAALKKGAIRHAHLYYAICRKLPPLPPAPPPPPPPPPHTQRPRDASSDLSACMNSTGPDRFAHPHNLIWPRPSLFAWHCKTTERKRTVLIWVCTYRIHYVSYVLFLFIWLLLAPLLNA